MASPARHGRRRSAPEVWGVERQMGAARWALRRQMVGSVPQQRCALSCGLTVRCLWTCRASGCKNLTVGVVRHAGRGSQRGRAVSPHTAVHLHTTDRVVGHGHCYSSFAAERHDIGKCLYSLKSESRFFLWIRVIQSTQLCAAGACLAVFTRLEAPFHWRAPPEGRRRRRETGSRKLLLPPVPPLPPPAPAPAVALGMVTLSGTP